MLNFLAVYALADDKLGLDHKIHLDQKPAVVIPDLVQFSRALCLLSYLFIRSLSLCLVKSEYPLAPK